MSTDEERDRASVELAPRSSVEVQGRRLIVRGPQGEVVRPFPSDVVTLAVSGTTALLTLTIPANRKRAQALLRTWAAHLRNLSVGVTAGFEAKMKVVAAHFPMKVSAKDDHLLIENFLGEKHPRSAPLVPGVTATVDGDFVLLSGRDIELVGQSAANIERATRIRDYDPRVFQDGIYLVERAHPKELA
ncbi:MAG: 50S ribosomal protein L6 [Thermoplasmata archaeon]|nr:50S ribosomal protein L6 [Thermoplasmata archaeon]MCI4359082.1 50S ribosomal protein L6 [Thermoplasmata archaeon]